MNYLKIYLFILHVILETTIFPNYLSSLLNSKSLYFLALLNGAFFTLVMLKKFNKFYILTFTMMDLYLFYELLKNNYIKDLNIADSFYIFFLSAFFIIIFIFTNKEEDYKEFQQSNNFNLFFSFIGNIIFSNALLYHFKNNHLQAVKEVASFDKVNFDKILIHFLVDYLIFTNFLTFTYVVKAAHSKSKKKHYIVQIIKKIFLFFLYTGLFYANYNTSLSEYIYSKFMDQVPKPHNVIVYNCMPLDADMRFRLIVVALLNIFS